MLTILPGAISSVSSPRSNLATVMASASNASTAVAMAFCLSSSGSIFECRLLFSPGVRPGPIQRALFPDVEKSGEDQNHKYQHFDETRHQQFAIHHRPGIEENGFNIEHNEEHRHQV